MDALIAYGALATDSPRNLRPIVLTVPGDCGLSADGEPVRIDFADAETRDEIGRILFAANAESLAARYGESGSNNPEMAGTIALAYALAESYAFKPATGPTEPAAIIGAADCFDYQAGEGEGWQMSLAQWLTAAIREKAAGEFRGNHWAINDEARDAETEALELAPAPAATGDAPAEPDARAAILARMATALCGGAPALPDPVEPRGDSSIPPGDYDAETGAARSYDGPAAGPKPEPETAAKAKAKAKAAKPGKATKGRKAPAATAGKGKNNGGKRAKPPASKNAAAPRAKGKAPLNA